MPLPGVVYEGPDADDAEVLAALPPAVRDLLAVKNGFIAVDGGLHVRGACLAPEWHSLRAAWWSDRALHTRYEALSPSDLPLAQDAVGDQWLLRDGKLWRLRAETGDLEATEQTLHGFLEAAEQSPVETLGLEPLLQFHAEGGRLRPGELLSVYPPFCAAESANGVSLRAVPAQERLDFLADLARQLPPEGPFRVRVE